MPAPCQITVGQYTINGMSLGGVQTCLQVPQLGLMFDVGHCPRSLVSTPRVFLTHSHGDHSGGIIGMLSLRLLMGIKEPLQLYMPEYMATPVRQAITAYENMQGHPYRYEIHPLNVGDTVALNKQQVVHTYESTHVVPGLGYTVVETVKKLRDEYKDLPGPEIGKLRLSGADIFDRRERPLISFPGDTSTDVLDKVPALYDTQILVLESTYLDDRRTVAQCRKYGHVHLDELIERADRFNNQHLVLTHFSQSYPIREIHDLIEKRFAPIVRPEVHPFTPTTGYWPD